MKSALISPLLAGLLLLTGCAQPAAQAGGGGGGTIKAINHTKWAINHFSINGQSGIDSIGPFQGHDSRAWFMYAALGTREMWTGYFRYRMIYFSERCSKPLSPLVLAGDLVGFATVTAGVVLSFRQKRLTGKLAGLAATGAVRSLEVAVLDKITGEALPELPGGEQLRAFTHEPGTVVAQQKARKAEEQLARGQAALPASWLEDVLTTTV
ncbi:lipoprotein [Klebsiella pneumoniae]|nr:lipoprotein [Klebsiella pneumoniae]